MKLRHLLIAAVPIALTVLSAVRCNKRPYVPNYNTVRGYVIGKELCNVDTTKDYWLVDLTYYPQTPPYGDTIIYNGQTYTNVVKTLGLSDRLRHIGTAVSLDFNTTSLQRVTTSNCTLPNTQTFDIKEIFIIHQSEIR